MLDSIMYPHLVDLVLEHAPRRSLFALRAASRSMREKSDARLAHHVVARFREDPTSSCLAPFTVEGPQGRIPLFYRPDEPEDTNLGHLAGAGHRGWWAASEDPQTALDQRAQLAGWCLKHTRVLDIAGAVPGSRVAELVSGVGENAVLRAIRGPDGLTILDPHTEHDDYVQDALDRPLSKFVTFANIWDLINMPEYALLYVGARKVVWNVFIEPAPHPAPRFEQSNDGLALSLNTTEIVIIFRPSLNPGPFTMLQRVVHRRWRARAEPWERDGRLEQFWEWLFATEAKVTLVNLAALDEEWGLSEEVELRRRTAETEAEMCFLTLEAYEREFGADFELETEEGAWCHWKPEASTQKPGPGRGRAYSTLDEEGSNREA